ALRALGAARLVRPRRLSRDRERQAEARALVVTARRRSLGCRRCAFVREGQHQRERAAVPRLAVEVELATEESCELPADRQAETGTAVLAARAAVGLLEGFEDDLLLLGRDADAG